MKLAKYIGGRIKYFRKLKKLTQEELGKMVGTSKAGISNYERGYRTPQQDMLFELSEALDISINDLFPETSKSKDITSLYNQLNDSNQSKVYTYASDLLEGQNNQVQESSVIYITSKLSAGTGIVDLDPDYQEERDYHGYVPKHDLAFIVDGDSMQPVFESGEVVFVEKTHEVRNGQIIAVQINEEAYIKKAYVEEDQLRLVSLNTKYDDIIADGGDDIRVVGRVVL